MMTILSDFKNRWAMPRLYVAAQYAVGAHHARRMCLDELAPRAGQKILDVGCGPAYYRDWLPAVDYYGFDTDEPAIEWARQRFAGKGQFFAEPFAARHKHELAPFDGILLMGLLHHLPDDLAHELLDLARTSLRPGGRVITLDTCFDARLSSSATWLARRDRGQFVRPSADFETMARQHFGKVRSRLVGDKLPMITAQLLMVLEA